MRRIVNSMALWIKTDGSEDLVAPAIGTEFTLAELHRVVGGYIEIVPIVCEPRSMAADHQFMVLNEDGKRLQLPINRRATALYHAAGGPSWDVIVGDVIIGTRRELGG
jgi:hypothetical protein